MIYLLSDKVTAVAVNICEIFIKHPENRYFQHNKSATDFKIARKFEKFTIAISGSSLTVWLVKYSEIYLKSKCYHNQW